MQLTTSYHGTDIRRTTSCIGMLFFNHWVGLFFPPIFLFILGNVQHNAVLTYSSTASYFRNIDSMKWNAYLEECIRELQKSNEHITDASLIISIRMQVILEKINKSPWFDGTDQTSGWKLYPPTIFIGAIQAELQAVKHDLQINFADDCKLVVAINTCYLLTIISSTSIFAILQYRDDTVRNWAFKSSSPKHSTSQRFSPT